MDGTLYPVVYVSRPAAPAALAEMVQHGIFNPGDAGSNPAGGICGKLSIVVLRRFAKPFPVYTGRGFESLPFRLLSCHPRGKHCGDACGEIVSITTPARPEVPGLQRTANTAFAIVV